jgi:hypothetical protein
LALFLACHENAFHDFGGVPEEILYGRVKTVWLGDDDQGDPDLHPGFVDFAEYYGCGLVALLSPGSDLRSDSPCNVSSGMFRWGRRPGEARATGQA